MPMKPILIVAAAAIVVSASSAAKKATTVVPLILYSYGYAPEPIVLKAGRPVTMVFSNRSGDLHEFKARDFFRSARILGGDPHNGEIHLKPGQSTSVTLIPTQGSYRVHCSEFLHTQFGMKTSIYVR